MQTCHFLRGKTLTFTSTRIDSLRLVVQVDLVGEVDEAILTHLALQGSSIFIFSIVELEVGVGHPVLVESQLLPALLDHLTHQHQPG